MRKPLWLLWFALTGLSAGCVTIPNTTACTVAGLLSAGMNCAETITGKTSELTLDETIAFLEPVEDRIDPDGKFIPGRAGAICQSAYDWSRMKTALEQACRELGARCSYEMRETIKALHTPQTWAWR